ncbi:hypothetical protein ES705_35471 [subsurface metagenome]
MKTKLTRKGRRSGNGAGGLSRVQYITSLTPPEPPGPPAREPREGPHHPTLPLHLLYITGLPIACSLLPGGALIAHVGPSRSETWPAQRNSCPLAIRRLWGARGPKALLPLKRGLGGLNLPRGISRERLRQRRTGGSRVMVRIHINL